VVEDFMRMLLALISVGALCVSGVSANAADGVVDGDDGRPRGTYIHQPDIVGTDGPGVARGGTPSLIIYMNRCAGGCTFTPGFNNSVSNQSSIIDSTINLPAYPYGDDSWNQMMACMREIYGPYNIEITDVDPSPANHIESVVAGSPTDAGFNPQVGGVSPFTCGFITNSVVYTFPEVWGNDPRTICETAGQETAHSFGFDHEYHCPDCMTYLTGCGEKTFRDVNAQCGEYNPRACQCGGSTQNSHQLLLEMFGARPTEPPMVSFEAPLDGATVQPQALVVVDATDDINVVDVEMWIDGVYDSTDAVPPYQFRLPEGLPEGNHSITARAVDGGGLITDATISVNLTGPCSSNDDDCSDVEVCDTATGNCVPGPGTPGGLGEPCAGNTDCFSGQCASDGTNSVCTQPCDLASPSCPDGFSCLDGGGVGVCWPAEGGGGGGPCGCRAGGKRGALPLFWLAMGVIGIGWTFARRRK
jgi:hypothetical protein